MESAVPELPEREATSSAPVVDLRLFAAARQAAGTGKVAVAGWTVGEVLAAARRELGEDFARVLEGSRVWRNGDPAAEGDRLAAGDEVAVLPPVSGGAR